MLLRPHQIHHGLSRRFKVRTATAEFFIRLLCVGGFLSVTLAALLSTTLFPPLSSVMGSRPTVSDVYNLPKVNMFCFTYRSGSFNGLLGKWMSFLGYDVYWVVLILYSATSFYNWDHSSTVLGSWVRSFIAPNSAFVPSNKQVSKIRLLLIHFILDGMDLVRKEEGSQCYLHGVPAYREQQGEFQGKRRVSTLSWTREVIPPHLSSWSQSWMHANLSHKFDGVDEWLGSKKLWKHPPTRGFEPCVERSESYKVAGETRGYLLVHTNGGLNQMRAGICDMVAVARIINATLVIPEMDKRSFWHDSSNFADIFDEKYFIDSLANDVKIVKKLPKELASAPRAVKSFRSWSGMDYYLEEIAPLLQDYKVIRAAKSDSRLANNNLPPDIQKLRCRVHYDALRFAPRIEAMGRFLVERMRSYGPYIALHLRYEKDMLAFSGCTYGLTNGEAKELTSIRQRTPHWKIKEINSTAQRSRGLCPLTPKEVGIFLSALGYPSDTPIYIAAGEIYGGEHCMAELENRFPKLMWKKSWTLLLIGFWSTERDQTLPLPAIRVPPVLCCKNSSNLSQNPIASQLSAVIFKSTLPTFKWSQPSAGLQLGGFHRGLKPECSGWKIETVCLTSLKCSSCEKMSQF
eukprot:Gb_02062 [translate_table: standard]